MNRFTFKSILAAFCLFLLPSMASALPGPHDPLTGGNGIVCESCHTAGSTLGATTWDNVCLTCHNGSSTAANGHIVQSFKQADFADPFGTSTPRTGTVYQTSHKWTGTDTQPLAGALPPTDKYATVAKNNMNKASIKGSVTCARCHNIHGNSGTPSLTSPYLRSINTDDQMCVDCHRTRDHVSQTFGTHPVNINYTATYNAYTAKFYPTPRSAYPNNTTAAMKLVNGKVQCSTCHGVHYTDSGKSGFAQKAVNFNKLTTANGKLIRANFRGAGATVNDINLCTNCHKGMSHNNAGQGIQCADCHTGHVEYDPTAADDQERLPNLKLIRRVINGRKVLFTAMTAASFTNPLKGVCTPCHTAPGSHSDGRASTNCTTSCHTHKGNGFGGGCASCHGFPPIANTAGGPNGYANDPATGHNYGGLKDESLTGHLTHTSAPLNYTCNDCHNGNTHNSGTFADVFNSAAGFKAAMNGATPGYLTAGEGTCSTVYCHSNGAAPNRQYKNVNWGHALTTGKILGTANECVACHNGVIAGFNNLSTNSHFKHVDSTGKTFGCVICHSATVSNNSTISNAANHVNGTRDVSFSGSLATGTSWNGSTCATSYCHSNGAGAYVATPTWATRASGQCGTCHATTPSIGGAAIIATNAHFTHLSTTYGPKITRASVAGCQTCHTSYTNEFGATHVNNIKEVGVCTPCHQGTAPTWTSAARLACTDCHSATPSVIGGITAPYKSSFVSSGHGQADANHTASASCTSCHDASKKHIDGALGSTEKRLVGANDNTLCSGCHNDVAKVPTVSRQNMVTHVTAHLSGATSDCKSCHDVHGTSNYAQIKVTINGATITFPASGANYINGTNDGLCQTCHTVTNHFRRLTAESGAGNGWVTSGTDHKTFTSATNCLSCHTHKGASYAFYPAGGACDSCHGYPPVLSMTGLGKQNSYSTARLQNYTGGGGVHNISAHVSPASKASNAWADCTKCHYGGSGSHSMDTSKFTTPGYTEQQRKANVNVIVDPQYKFNSSFTLDQVRYDNSKVTPNNTGNCSNVSCHFQKSPRWATDK